MGPAAGVFPGLELLVVQPTPFCNLACTYCYLPNKDDRRRISDATLRAIFKKVLASGLVTHDFTVVWHAGEPMAVGIPFYERAFAIAAEYRPPEHRLRHSFQTNGTLITPAWCDFIRAHRVSIGVSIDGPATVHDRSRLTRSGGPTHARVMGGIDRLRQADIDFHVISVLTRDALARPDEMYDFYVANGIRRVCFNFEEKEGVHAASSLEPSGVREEARAFLSRFLQRVMSGGTPMAVREFDGLRNFVLHGKGHGDGRCQESFPFRVLTFDIAGNFGTFSPELLGMSTPTYGGDFLLGNIHRDDIAEVVQSEKVRRMSMDIAEGIEICRASCEYFGVCGGGHASNKYFENGTFASAETMSCRLSKKALIDAVLGTIERELGLSAAGGVP